LTKQIFRVMPLPKKLQMGFVSRRDLRVSHLADMDSIFTRQAIYAERAAQEPVSIFMWGQAVEYMATDPEATDRHVNGHTVIPATSAI
jgi:hypothetical protein